ncbi:MAG TPA: DUF711 family protein [Anaerolineae bacterium]|nr:DUF711 family protein [Anaerolineae bacterium]
MNMRSVTCFAAMEEDPAARERALLSAGSLAKDARAALEAAGFPVQSLRLATQPLSLLPGNPGDLAAELWDRCEAAGFGYLSLGPVLADSAAADLSRLDQVPGLIRANHSVFASVLVARSGRGIHLAAIRRTAQVVREIAHTTPLGFGNLRLAMLANVKPHSPFFPAAYHDAGPPAVALATESAPLAVEAFSGAASLAQARHRLVEAIEGVAERAAACIRPLADRHGYRFAGIDFSLAPFPEEARSIGTAMERLGVERFGAPGTLFAAAFLTGCLRQARFPRCGFSGLMLPVLEDHTMAERTHDRLFGVNDLLLYSAVCGTGLDTVPLPGDVSETELSGILLDVAALAMRLDKPLTARLMPLPGKRAGDPTEFDFSYFANGSVLEAKGMGSPAIFDRADWLPDDEEHHER